MNGFLRATFPGNEDADALDDLSGRAGSLGEEHIGMQCAVVGVNCARNDHRGQAGVELFGASNKFIAIHLGHDEVAQKEVDGAGDRALDYFERVVRTRHGDDAVAARLKQKGADRKRLFVVVYAENCLLGPHSSLASAAALKSRDRMDPAGIAPDG